MNAADAIWIATVHLHQEHPDAEDFAVSDIIERTHAERLADDLRPITINAHVNQHTVANRRALPSRLRMLHETAPGRRRLHWPWDSAHPDRQGPSDRAGTRITPLRESLPPKYHDLLDWYDAQQRNGRTRGEDPLLALIGAGADLWRDETPDDYVQRIRERWP